MCRPFHTHLQTVACARFAPDFLDEHVELALALHLRNKLLELLFALSLREEILDLSADFLERRGARRPPLENLDDVVAEGSFDDAADRAGLELERCVFEGGRHLTLGE